MTVFPAVVEPFALCADSRVFLDASLPVACIREDSVLTVIPADIPHPPRESHLSHSPSLADETLEITPSIEELRQLPPFQLAAVSGVTIERKEVGKIAFLEPVDLRDVAVEKVVKIATENGIPAISVGMKLPLQPRCTATWMKRTSTTLPREPVSITPRF